MIGLKIAWKIKQNSPIKVLQTMFVVKLNFGHNQFHSQKLFSS